jgi:hypothetical protein
MIWLPEPHCRAGVRPLRLLHGGALPGASPRAGVPAQMTRSRKNVILLGDKGYG